MGPPPRYRALSFELTGASDVELWVRGDQADAMAWLGHATPVEGPDAVSPILLVAADGSIERLPGLSRSAPLLAWSGVTLYVAANLDWRDPAYPNSPLTEVVTYSEGRLTSRLRLEGTHYLYALAPRPAEGVGLYSWFDRMGPVGARPAITPLAKGAQGATAVLSWDSSGIEFDKRWAIWSDQGLFGLVTQHLNSETAAIVWASVTPNGSLRPLQELTRGDDRSIRGVRLERAGGRWAASFTELRESRPTLQTLMVFGQDSP